MLQGLVRLTFMTSGPSGVRCITLAESLNEAPYWPVKVIAVRPEGLFFFFLKALVRISEGANRISWPSVFWGCGVDHPEPWLIML